MLLGQVVAISVASNLFFIATILHGSSTSRPPPSTRVPPRVYTPVLLSHLTILLCPRVARPDSRWFLPNLLAMHLLIVLPLVKNLPSNQIKANSCLSVGSLYLILASLSLVPRAQTYFALSPSIAELGISGLVRELVATLYSHPAQSSIGFDVVWTTLSFMVYCAVSGRSALLGLVALVSPGLALYLDSDSR